MDDMDLPAGKTCGDCAGWHRCKAFIGSLKPTNTRCDWSPSAFRARDRYAERGDPQGLRPEGIEPGPKDAPKDCDPRANTGDKT